MNKLNFVLTMMSLLTMILGCGGTSSAPPKEWQKAKPLIDKLDHPSALANDGKFIYFITGGTVASRSEGTNNVVKIPAAGGAPTIIFKGGDIIPDASAIALDENYVYFSANGLRRVPKTGGAATLLTKAFIAWEIIADKENIYWLPFVGEGMPPAPIYSVPKTGGAPKTLTDPRRSANGLCVDDKFVYWIQTDGIYKTGKQGGSVEKVYSTPSDKEVISDLKSDADNFYFLEVRSESLMKLEKTGQTPKLIARNVENFWLGTEEIILQRTINFSEKAIVKIGKNGESEIQLDSGGYLFDATVGADKIYLSDVQKIFEIGK